MELIKRVCSSLSYVKVLLYPYVFLSMAISSQSDMLKSNSCAFSKATGDARPCFFLVVWVHFFFSKVLIGPVLHGRCVNLAAYQQHFVQKSMLNASVGHHVLHKWPELG